MSDALHTDNPLVGRRVLNVHRQSCDYPESYRRANHGTVVGVLPGCNALVAVLFDGRDRHTLMVEADLAFVELWPGAGSRVRIPDQLRQADAWKLPQPFLVQPRKSEP